MPAGGAGAGQTRLLDARSTKKGTDKGTKTIALVSPSFVLLPVPFLVFFVSESLLRLPTPLRRGHSATQKATLPMPAATVILYTLSTCPWCAKAKRFFAERHVPVRVIDYDLADAATQARISQELNQHGVSGFPYAVINGRVVAGYDPMRYATLLLLPPAK